MSISGLFLSKTSKCDIQIWVFSIPPSPSCHCRRSPTAPASGAYYPISMYMPALLLTYVPVTKLNSEIESQSPRYYYSVSHQKGPADSKSGDSMEPDTHSSFTSFHGTIPPPTLPDNSEQAQEDSASQEKQTKQNPESIDWTVYSPNVARGNLDRPEDSKDPRKLVGWTASSHKTAETVPWMSTTKPQPVMDSGGYVLKDNEA